MAAGSAFDAFVKSYLHDKIYGQTHKDSNQYQLKALFEAQVEPQVRDIAWVHGFHAFNCYKNSGALADLMLDLDKAVSDPRFEFSVQATIRGSKQLVTDSGVPLLGKPDIFFINSEGAKVILDWKVNGMVSKYPPSPMPGYMKCTDGCNQGSKSNGAMHKNCQPINYRGMMINGASYLEQGNREWASQLATYSWLLGEPVGTEVITAIDQIVCDARTQPPLIRIAAHRTRVSEAFQYQLLDQYLDLWDCITTGYFFKDVSRADSDGMCQLLDEESKQLYGNNQPITEDMAWFLSME